MTYEADSVKGKLDAATTHLDQIAIHLQGIEGRLKSVQDIIIDIGLVTDFKVAASYQMTTALNDGIDSYLKGVFGLRSALNDYREFL